MPLVETSRRRNRTLAALTLALAIAPPLLASNALQGSSCDSSGDSLNCRLLDVLHFLYGAAGILGLILLIVVAVAIQIYRKNRQPPKGRP